MHARSALALASLALILAPAVVAQPEPPPSRHADVRLDSGPLPAPVKGPEVVYATEVHVPGAQWLRLVFDDATALIGDPKAGTGSWLVITAASDGYSQRLDVLTLTEWGHTSAYFNGDTVLLELWSHAAPVEPPSRVIVTHAIAGEAPAGHGPDNVCGPIDERLPSNYPFACRLMPIGCTAYLIHHGQCANQFITAGHCITANQQNAVVQFNVPFSNANGSLNHPPPEYQYPVQPVSIQTSGSGGLGNDYAVFMSFSNGNTGRPPREAQRGAYALASSSPAPGGQTIRIVGYAARRVNHVPIPFEWNQTQKTSTGPFVDKPGFRLMYQVSTEGGNSGSPVILESTGEVIGVHTHGGCRPDGTGANSGTAIEHPGFQNFLANPRGTCLPFVQPDCLDTTYVGGQQAALGGAVYFDIQVGASPIELWGLDFNLGDASTRGATFGVEVFTTPGGHAGKVNSQFLWHAAGKGVGIVQPTGLPSRMLLEFPVRLEPNRAYGLALMLTNASHELTPGTGSNQQYITPHLTMTLGAATDAPFLGAVRHDRVWNGGLCYDVLSTTQMCLTTLFGANDQGPPGGMVYFDLEVGTQGVLVHSIALSTTAPAGTPLTLRTYVRNGASVGNQTNPAGWLMRAVGNAVSAGPGNPTLFAFPLTFGLNGGFMYGVALHLQGGGHAYTIGDGFNETYHNAIFRLRNGTATNQPFTAPVITPRVFNGEICVSTEPPECYPDCDQSGIPRVLDIFDFLCFGNAFAAGDPYACDCDLSTGLGVCDVFDFLCFGNAFAAGCP